MKTPPESSVLEDVNSLRSLVVSVLPQLLLKLDLIGNKLESSPTTPTNTASTTRVEISTQTEGEFVGGSSGAEADEILEDGVRLEDLLWTEPTLPAGIKVESLSEGGAAEGIECSEDESVDSVLQESACSDHGGQVISCSLPEPSSMGPSSSSVGNANILNVSTLWGESYVAADESQASVAETKFDLASTSHMNEVVLQEGSSQPDNNQFHNTMSLRVRDRRSCSFCGKYFRSAAHRVRHERIHTGEKPFKCSYCSKAFAQRYDAVKHERIHTGEKPYKCVHCSMTFSVQGGLIIHMRKSHNALNTSDERRTPITTEEFIINSGAPDAEYSDKDDGPLECRFSLVEPKRNCSFCGRYFKSAAHCVRHERIHTGEKPFKCSFCSRPFAQRCDVVKHERIHTGEKPYKCVHCSKTFAARGGLTLHKCKVEQHAPTTPNTADTTRAEISTQTEGEFGGSNSDEADEILEGQEDGIPLEDLLWAEATLPGGIKVESLSEGGAAEGIECCEDESADNGLQESACSDDFGQVISCSLPERFSMGPSSSSVGNANILNVSTLWGESYVTAEKQIVSHAPVAETKFDLASTSHMNEVVLQEGSSQPGNNQFHNTMSLRVRDRRICSFCGKFFQSAGHCIRHERIHTGEKPFKCSYCSKAFAQRYDAVTHERVHTGEKPFKCRYCPKRFKQRGDICAHERVHSGEAPFVCSYCSKAFRRKADAVKHERIHTREMPFKCKHCPKAFKCSSYLAKHERRCPCNTS